MLNCIFRFLLSSLLFGGKKNPPNSIGNLPWMCPPESLPDSMSLKNDEHNGQGRLQLQRKPAFNWPANPCTTRKSSFFCPQLLPTGYLWQFTSAAIYVAVCYYFVVLHLFSVVRTSHHCQRFCRVINLSTEDKNRWVWLFLFQRALSILYSWGRQTQINSWSGEKKGTKPDKNGG